MKPHVIIKLVLVLIILSLLVIRNRSSYYTVVNPVAGDRLNENQTLNKGEQKTSQDGKYRYKLETNGKLALYNSAGTEIWSVNPPSTADSTNRYLKLETNGNLVMYDATPRRDAKVWETNTTGKGQSNSRFFVIQNDGNLILWAKIAKQGGGTQDSKLWQTSTVGK